MSFLCRNLPFPVSSEALAVLGRFRAPGLGRHTLEVGNVADLAPCCPSGTPVSGLENAWAFFPLGITSLHV